MTQTQTERGVAEKLLMEATTLLMAKSVEVDAANKSLNEANSRHVSALNALNEAQKNFDKATMEVKKFSAKRGSDWEKPATGR